ncbi:MAG: endonuclease/exonuclease/phosphatase family protein [Cyclobacteriaceae bacterium]|nr:endonuclease/exonuclease/phosphatase family protein [Cyclobacteriaceae bacterium]
MKKIFDIFWMAISLLVLLSVWIPPDKFWPAGFIAYTIPLILFLNLVIFIWRLGNLRISAIYPLLVLILGFGFIRDTISFNSTDGEEGIKILTYNTKVFNLYNLNGRDTVSVGKMINWIKSQDADVLCFQEFYNDPGSKQFNTIAKIRKIHNFHYYSNPVYVSRSGGEFGPIIFSRYPIINKGALKFNDQAQNNVIFADLQMGDDTVRVYNMHLHSMHINEESFINSNNFQEGFTDLSSRLKNGFIQRAQQIRILKDHLDTEQFPLLVCGDLNDIPYSYAYQQLDDKLNDGFVQAGNGFGFTYNGKFLFIRIDHQFYSDHFKIHTFQVNKELRYSDHFPVIATYSLKKSR